MSDELKDLVESQIFNFNKCTDKTKIGDSVFMIDCKLGLWGVQGINQECVMAEAFNYWRQYESDGEYSSIIGGKSSVEKLINKGDKQ